MKLNPYLNFDGNCADALKFYEKSLGAKVEFKLTYGESPMKCDETAGLNDKIMHARISLDGNILMLSDCPPGRYEAPKGMSVSLSIEKSADAERVFAALSEKGNVIMPIAETFWAQRFGMLVDQFGIPWMINCEKPM